LNFINDISLSIKHYHPNLRNNWGHALISSRLSLQNARESQLISSVSHYALEVVHSLFFIPSGPPVGPEPYQLFVYAPSPSP
jgi:hypothetical protein